MAFTAVTVTGKYLTPAGAAESGTVSFTLSAPMMDAAGKTIRSTAAVTTTLDGTGAFSVVLPANDDTGTVPTGTTYEVIERLSAGVRAYAVVVPHTAAAGTVDITALAPVANGSITYGVTSVNGQTGAVTISNAASSADDLFVVDDETAGYGYWGINVMVPAGADPTYFQDSSNSDWYVIPADTPHTFADVDPAPVTDPTPGGLFLAVCGKVLGDDTVLPSFPLHKGWVPVSRAYRWLAVITKNMTIVGYVHYEANHTVLVQDIGRTLRIAHPSNAITVKLPALSNDDVPVGSTVEIMRYGAGTVTIAADTGATVETNAAGLGIAARYGSAVAEKTASTEWVVRGDLT